MVSTLTFAQEGANVRFGSRLCKNVTARGGDRMSVSLNRNNGRESL